MTGDLHHQNYLIIRDGMVEYFEPDEVEELCHRLGVKAALFRRARLAELVDDLLQWADDNGRRAALIALLRRERPDIEWPADYAFPPGADTEARWQPDPPPDPDAPIPTPGPLPPGSRVVLPPNPLFTGREDELRALARALLPDDDEDLTGFPKPVRSGHLVIISTGIGGVGKTQLAAEFAHRYGRHFYGVHWVSLADPDAAGGEIAACGQMMGLHPAFSELPLPDQVAAVQRVWAGPEPRLVVFDNCEDPELLRRWRPAGGGARLLVTSRVGQWPAEFGAPGSRCSPCRATRASTCCGPTWSRPGGPRAKPDLRRVADAVGDLPLALGLAGHFLARYRETSLDDYLAELAAAPELVPVGRDAVSATRHELSVWQTFKVSFDRLGDDPVDHLAKALLARAACFAPGEPLPEALLRAAAVDEDGEPLAPPRDLTDALAALVAAGLLEQPEAGVVRLHRLLARFVTIWPASA
jgi:hypothetical protein